MNSFQILFHLITLLGFTGETQGDADNREVDFIVVGAGAAGAAVASRLSENVHYSVLLLEAGEEPLRLTKIPYFAFGPIRGKMDWNYKTEKLEHSGFNYFDQKIHWPRGKALGGSTAINALFFTRGDEQDYDHWKALGNEGWGYEDILPLFKKMEDYRAPLIRESDREVHGTGGPMSVDRPPFSTSVADAFLEAGKEMGYQVNDYNSGKQTGFSNPVYILANGSRYNTYDAYVKPFLHRKNLQVISNALVTKVLFDENKKAVGVEFEIDGKSLMVKSKKEVVLCAGASNSPQLLMLSGIGPKETLDKFKIPVVADLIGVGSNLRDHVIVGGGVTYTFPEFVGINHNYMVNAETLELWETKGEGPLTVPIRCEGIAFINSKFAPSDGDYPDVEIVMHQLPGFNLDMYPQAAKALCIPDDNENAIMMSPIHLRPKSIGYLTLRSSDPHDPPLIQPNYLADENDVEVLVDALKFSTKLMETEPFKKLGGKRLMKKALGCESYEQFSDDYYHCLVRRYVAHAFHPVGTCKMGLKTDETAVVDNKLRVYGVTGLRVADASIMPTLTSAHTMAPSIMIGEKVAAMILEDWQTQHEEL